MIYYLIYKVYYNTIKQSYDKIIGFDSKITDNNLINKVKPISIKPIEKVGLTLHSCFYVLKHPTESHRNMNVMSVQPFLCLKASN